MTTVSFSLPCDVSDHDVVSAMLHHDLIEGMEERENELIVFVSNQKREAFIKTLLPKVQHFLTGPVDSQIIQNRNWNEEWEKTIQSISVPPFWIRPTWNDTPVPSGMIELIIDPKMSFGTGYHQSTRLMLGALQEMIKPGDRVLDAGTGTGVLGFAALMVGATSVQAFDFDPICYDSATENAILNGVSERFEAVVGDETVVSGTFDVVLANINREALRAMIPTLCDHMNPGAKLGLAGLLKTDRETMMTTLERVGLTVIREAEEGDWWSVWASDKPSGKRLI